MTSTRALELIDRTPSSIGRRLEYDLADSLETGAPEFADELIEGFIAKRSISVLYGDSNSGKTFLAIDIGCAVARKTPWMGRQVDGGMVVYLATESPTSVRNRLRVYQVHHRNNVPYFVIVNSPINLFQGSADTTSVVDLIRSLESELGVKCELVICDTLARMSAGANENSGQDMTTVLANLDYIKDEARTAVLLIHHTGKDAAKGMRGWSGLRAAVDTELEVSGADASGISTVEITKQRDMAGKGTRIGFRLETVAMGIGKWKTPQTSCIVVSADAPLRSPDGLRLGKTQLAILAALRSAKKDLRISEIARDLSNLGILKSSVYNAVDRLVEKALVEVVGGVVHLIKPAP